jgi:hypothetical protein
MRERILLAFRRGRATAYGCLIVPDALGNIVGTENLGVHTSGSGWDRFHFGVDARQRMAGVYAVDYRDGIV